MAEHQEPVPGGISNPTAGGIGATAAVHRRRPGILTFAAVMMFVVAGLEALAAIYAFAGNGWWVTYAGNLVYANFFVWGLLDTIIALIALFAGISILRGGAFGLVMGFIFAVMGAIRWTFVIPAAPVLAVVVLALCVMVIYGLAKYADDFEA
jgi:hypothetical protein